jgi:LysM repeat protein
MYKYVLLALSFLLVACQSQEQTSIPTYTAAPPPPTATHTLVAPTPTPTPIVYVVQAGDSLSGIALKFDLPVEALAEANGIEDPNVIKVGQELIIPGPTAIPTSTVPPTTTPTPNVPPKLEIVEVIGRGAPATETVIVANRGRSVFLKEWTLRDSQGNVFIFPNLFLAEGTEVRIHTGQGDDTATHLYWNRDTAVWEEQGDTVVLADERGVIYASKTLD